MISVTSTIRRYDALLSADSAKPTGAGTPADALGVTKRMTTSDDDSNQFDDHECPTCSRSFDSKRGVSMHHVQTHGESIAKTELVCEWCGETFERYESAIKSGENFCGVSCRREWHSEAHSGEEHWAWDGGTETLECATCGDLFEVYPNEVERGRRFCSNGCKGQWISEWRTGSDHPLWEGGYSQNRGTNWPKLRQKTLEENDYLCQGCGRHDDDHRDEHGVGLHVHHIRPVTEFDEPADADTVDNLVPLCRECHREWEGLPVRPQLTD